MKQFIADRSGLNPTLEEVPNEKVKVYDSKTDMDTDISNIAEGEIVATKAGESEGVVEVVDEVTDGVMNPVTSNAVADCLSYSTTEQLTGGKWIDGKPIYVKVVDLGHLPNSATKTVNHNISNIDKIIYWQGCQQVGNSTYQPSNFDGTSFTNMYITKTQVVIITNWNGSSSTGCVIISYTKTTD